MSFKLKSGFTLIELLVVVAIISLLSSVVLASLNSARSKARDAKRKEDLHQIRLALQLYYDAYGIYPSAKPNNACGSSTELDWAHSIGTCGGQWLTADSNFYQFMPSVPVDPLNTGANAGSSGTSYVYSYYPSLGGADYELIAQLENSADKQACGNTPAYYHNIVPNPSWCSSAMNPARSLNIIADH